MTFGRESDQNLTQFDRLPVNEMVAVNQWCDRLESSWQADLGHTVLKDLAQQVPLASRDKVFPELVLVDIELRLRAGLAITALEYLDNFPELDSSWLELQIQGITEHFWMHRRGTGSLPKSLGDYDILYELGSGGMGQVFRARHRIMKRDVAIKMLLSSICNDAAARRRFEREVRAISSLGHANIVAAFDAREENGRLYLVTEYIDGVSLSRLVRDAGPLDAMKSIDYLIQAASGLSFAHGHGIIHRDVKPSNLLVDWSDTVKILDLGLARWTGDLGGSHADETLTSVGQVLGTAHWMSPEQYRAPLTADARSDIYSLGCTLFFLLTGKPPYQGETFVDVIVAHANQPIPKLIHPELKRFPEKLESLVQSMLAKDPSERPQSMANVVDRLREIRATKPGKLLVDETVALAPNVTLIPDEASTRAGSLTTILASSRRRKFAWTLLAVLCVTVSALLIRFNSSSNVALEVHALHFNGVDDYLSVEGFDLVLDGPIMVEAIIAHKLQPSPSHVATWSGAKNFSLFITSDQRLGVAYFDGASARLVQSVSGFEPDTETLVAGKWTGNELVAFINGAEVPTSKIEYPLHRLAPGLFFGGLPEGHLPPEQGTRYFCGAISAVHVRMASTLPDAAQSLTELLKPTRDSIAMFDFRTTSSADPIDFVGEFTDLTPRAWLAAAHRLSNGKN